MITPDGNNGASLTAGGHIDRPQFRAFVGRGGWTNRCVESGSSTRVGVDDRGKIQTRGNRRGFGLASWSAKKSSDGYLIDDLRQRRTDSGTPEGGTSVTYHRVFSDPKLAAPIPFDQESLGLGRWAVRGLHP